MGGEFSPFNKREKALFKFSALFIHSFSTQCLCKWNDEEKRNDKKEKKNSDKQTERTKTAFTFVWFYFSMSNWDNNI